MIRTQTKIATGHRQLNDPTNCGFLHGHNWMIEFVVSAPTVDNIGYVVDFKVLKAIANDYDHTVLLNIADPLGDILIQHGQRVCKLPLNPTAENLAILIKERVLETIGRDLLDFVSITVWESDVSCAIDSWKRGD